MRTLTSHTLLDEQDQRLINSTVILRNIILLCEIWISQPKITEFLLASAQIPRYHGKVSILLN